MDLLHPADFIQRDNLYLVRIMKVSVMGVIKRNVAVLADSHYGNVRRIFLEKPAVAQAFFLRDCIAVKTADTVEGCPVPKR